jgi:hypothetical protein
MTALLPTLQAAHLMPMPHGSIITSHNPAVSDTHTTARTLLHNAGITFYMKAAIALQDCYRLRSSKLQLNGQPVH